MEVSVRSARLTDVDAAVRLIAREATDRQAERDEADRLRHLLFIPAATVVVAIAERRLIGVGVLSIRPSVRSGPFVGVVDELGIEDGQVAGSAAEADDAALRDDVAGRMLDQLIVSARNKGCSRVEVTDPLASAEPALKPKLAKTWIRPETVPISPIKGAMPTMTSSSTNPRSSRTISWRARVCTASTFSERGQRR